MTETEAAGHRLPETEPYFPLPAKRCIFNNCFIIVHPDKSLPGSIQKRSADHIQIRNHKQHQYTGQTWQQKQICVHGTILSDVPLLIIHPLIPQDTDQSGWLPQIQHHPDLSNHSDKKSELPSQYHAGSHHRKTHDPIWRICCSSDVFSSSDGA